MLTVAKNTKAQRFQRDAGQENAGQFVAGNQAWLEADSYLLSVGRNAKLWGFGQ